MHFYIAHGIRLILYGVLILPGYAYSSQLYKNIDLVWERHEPGDSIYFDESIEENVSFALDLALEDNGERIAVTATNINDDNEFVDNVVLTEVYKDFSIAELDFTIGKKRVDWGVGYAYRPLNYLKPQVRNATGIVVEEGAWIGSAEKYTDSGKVALVAFNNKSQLDSQSDDTKGIGIHVYSLRGDWEIQTMGFYDDLRHGILGGSVNTVIGDSTTFHSSVVWQHKYAKTTHRANASNFQQNTINEEELDGGFQSLFGLTHNFANNISLLAEYWYDSRGPTRKEWENLFAAGQLQSQTAELAPLLFAAGQVFTATNLVQHNVLLHARYEGSKFNPVLDMQLAPADSGLITTGRVGYEWMPGQNIEIGARGFGGASNSVYSQLPRRNTYFFRISGSF